MKRILILRTLTVLIVLLSLFHSINASNTKDTYKSFFNYGFAPIEIDSLWGLTYNGELCLYPSYDMTLCSVSYYDYDSKKEVYKLKQSPNFIGLFAYNDSGKWGLASVHGELTEPLYDSIRIFADSYTGNIDYIGYGNQYFAIVEQDQFYGIVDALGNELLEPQYLNILGPFKLHDPYNKKLGDIRYFIAVNGDASFSLLDFCGNVLIEEIAPEILPNDYTISKKLINHLKKQAISVEKQLEKQDPINDKKLQTAIKKAEKMAIRS